MAKPIPPLTPEMMRAPEFNFAKPPKRVEGPKPVVNKVPATVSTAAPQPHSWEDRVEKAVEGMEPASTNPAPVEPSASVSSEKTPTESAPAKISWAQMATVNKAAPAPKVAPKAPARAAPPARSRTLSTTEQSDDFDEIMRYIDHVMSWEGKIGPTCRIRTKLTWSSSACRELYLYVKEQLHDKPFRVGRTRLYFYVGGIGNWGKAGFRISGHTKPLSNIQNSKTCGVLHIDN